MLQERMRDSSLPSRRLLLAAAVAVGAFGARQSLAAYTYTFTDVGSALNSDNYTSFAQGLNLSDQVVGYYLPSSSSSTRTAFVYNLSGGAVSNIAGLNAGGTTQAFGINNAGVVVGENYNSSTTNGAFYATPSNYGAGASNATIFAPNTLPNGSGTILYAVGNDTNSSAVGAASETTPPGTLQVNRGVAYNPTNLPITNIGDGFSGAPTSTSNSTDSNFAMAINSNGDIAGYGYNASAGLTDAYIATHTATPGTYTYTDVGTSVAAAVPGALGTYAKSTATGINKAGDVVGTFTTGGATTYSYFYNGSNAVIFTNPYSSSSSIRFTGINDSNQIVGYASSVPVPGDGSITVGFELDEATDSFTLLDNIPTGVSGQYYQVGEALAINDNGDIAGYATTSGTGASSTQRAVLLTGETAVPEPASLGMLGVGVVALLGRRKARRLA